MAVTVNTSLAQKVTCVNDGGSPTIVPEDRINDNYCDCPLTGADEPETAACAGSRHWPGRAGNVADGERYVLTMNNGMSTLVPMPNSHSSSLLWHSPVLFTCPQQPGLKLSLSKINDGICDCCDGADEGSGKCPDDCQAILAEARRQRQALQDAFTAGSKQRQKDLDEYAALVEQSKQTLEIKGTELNTVQTSRSESEEALKSTKVTWIKTRLEDYQTRVKALFGTSESAPLPDLRDLLDPLTTTELQNLIVHSCQIAGEIFVTSKHQTCSPLRLAGLAAGVRWEHETYTLTKVSEDTLESWADVMYYNIHNPGSEKWHFGEISAGTTNGRRRLDDYDYEEDFDEDMHGDYDPDDFEENDEEKYDEQHNNRRFSGKADEGKDGDSDQRQTQTLWVKEQPFSVPRVRFLTQTDTLLENLDKLTTDVKREESDEETPEPQTGFDPMAAPLLRSQITRRRDAIEKGFTYAVSARVLLQELDDRDILRSLLYGVWYHGKLSAWHMWQVYQSVIPELGGTVADAESCRAVWACPPVAATRKLGREQVTLPPAFFVQVADEHCRLMAAKGTDATTSCKVDDGTIPSEITDGMYGYYAVEPRSSEDVANVLFHGLPWEEDTSNEYAQLQKLMDIVEDLGNQESDLEQEISRIKNEMGQNDDASNKYGTNGELYSLRNTCLEMPAGKYVYELCLFKSSKQKEGNQSGGTDLGRWSGSSVSENGQRVLSWENGAKCWNGPKRSAWAYLTCGATTQIISADEPETCKYVFEVESHIACDEAYRLQNNLE